MNLSSLPYLWVLVLIPLVVRLRRDADAFVATLPEQTRSAMQLRKGVMEVLLDGTIFTVTRERLRASRTPQTDERCEQLRQRMIRSRRLLLIALFVIPSIVGVGGFGYVLWHGPVR
jgi:nitrate reductase NapE component